jgi:hypothetical protein
MNLNQNMRPTSLQTHGAPAKSFRMALLSWEIYEILDEIKEKVRAFIEDFSRETIASITGWNYILSIGHKYCSKILDKWYKLKLRRIQKYIGRLIEPRRSQRGHSSFWVGLYSQLWTQRSRGSRDRVLPCNYCRIDEN